MAAEDCRQAARSDSKRRACSARRSGSFPPGSSAPDAAAATLSPNDGERYELAAEGSSVGAKHTSDALTVIASGRESALSRLSVREPASPSLGTIASSSWSSRRSPPLWSAVSAGVARRCSATRATGARAFAAAVSQRGATIVRPQRKDEPTAGPHLAPIHQRIESIFRACEDLLTLERHGAHTLAGLRERILARFCCVAAAISLCTHQLGRPAVPSSTNAPNRAGSTI